MERVIRLGERAAQSQIPILIEGESGVGKEMIARAIQGASDRRSQPFITVNCGAIPDNLVESILFGHEKGAFTGAADKHIGKFREAHGGTLFLDEVGELPLDVQVKLLRALQDGEIDPVGRAAADPRRFPPDLGHQPQPDRPGRSAATSARTSTTGSTSFRSACRRSASAARTSPSWSRHFTARFAAEEGKAFLRGVDRSTPSTSSTAYDWPGNIRQLENAVFRAVVLADGPMLTRERIPADRRPSNGGAEPLPADVPSAPDRAARDRLPARRGWTSWQDRRARRGRRRRRAPARWPTSRRP